MHARKDGDPGPFELADGRARSHQDSSLDHFDVEFNMSVKRKQIYELAAGDFVRNHHDAILIGPPGVGNSHPVQSMGRQLIRDGYWIYYRSIFDCVRAFLYDEAHRAALCPGWTVSC